MPIFRTLRQLGSLWLATLCGCSYAPPAKPADPPTATARPFVIPEAKLPAGFPAPGPVGRVILKQYPACREARVDAPDAGQNSMFLALFNHIKTNDIPMTAPVEMTYDPAKPADPADPTDPIKPTAMAFIYGQPTTGKPGEQGNVHVIDLPPQIVVSIGVRGSYSPAHLKAALEKLNAFLAIQPQRYKVTGPPRYLGYNSPFVPWFMRFGEVQLPVVPVN